jgi:hypothetical protein
VNLSQRALSTLEPVRIGCPTSEIDQAAQDLSDAFRLAATAVGSRHNKPKAWPWWSYDLDQAQQSVGKPFGILSVLSILEIATILPQ